MWYFRYRAFPLCGFSVTGHFHYVVFSPQGISIMWLFRYAAFPLRGFSLHDISIMWCLRYMAFPLHGISMVFLCFPPIHF